MNSMEKKRSPGRAAPVDLLAAWDQADDIQLTTCAIRSEAWLLGVDALDGNGHAHPPVARKGGARWP
jgi:hypothetical protein